MEIFKQITANNIELTEYPFLKELAMEAYLIENEGVLKLDNVNFSSPTVLDAEIALKRGRKTSDRDGRIDILVKYEMDYLAIVELKIKEINLDTLEQLEDYLGEKDQILESNHDYWKDDDLQPQWIGVLIGTSISAELQQKLQEGYKTDSGIPIAAMVIRRFRGQSNEIFVISDTFFNYNYTNRDLSKFLFNGFEYNKSRLVNEVVKAYVERNPNITYSELEKVFPSRIQGSMGVFTTQDNAKAIFDRTGHKRYYLKSDELIELSDGTIATCTQWGLSNIKTFIDHVHNLNIGFKISS